ncbi:hypothetical protein ACVBEF_04195 [Glaciimonas sp. GG7]
MWTILFFLFALSLFITPLLPALRELLWPTDIDPLNIAYDHDRSITRFARRLAQLSREYLAALSLPESAVGSQLKSANMAEFLIVIEDAALPLEPEEVTRRMTERRLVGEKNLMLPDCFDYAREVYAIGNIQSGINNHFRALFAEGDIALRSGNQVLRWVHARRLHIGAEAVLYGRASADDEMHFHGAAHFERLNAPRICVGEVNRHSPVDVAGADAKTVIERPSALALIAHQVDQRPDEGRMIALGDLTLPADTVLYGDLIVRGKLRIGAGVLVLGSIKAHRSIQMEAGVTVRGAVVSAGRIICGNHAVIDGPLISEQAVLIGHGARIGSLSHPTSISAPVIKLYAHNTIAYGTVWARERGVVVNRGTNKAAL